MTTGETVSKLKVKVYAVFIKILIYQFRFTCESTINYFVEYLLFSHKLNIWFYSVDDYVIHLISACTDHEH